MKVYFAADHAGYELKNVLLAYVRDNLGHDVEDCGAFAYDKDDDYPPIIAAGAKKLSHDVGEGRDSRLITVGGSGQGEMIVPNRFMGVRCTLYYGDPGVEQTDMSGKTLGILESMREHNNSNALSIGARFLSVEKAKEAVRIWLATPFPGEARHVRRIAMIDSLNN